MMRTLFLICNRHIASRHVGEQVDDAVSTTYSMLPRLPQAGRYAPWPLLAGAVLRRSAECARGLNSLFNIAQACRLTLATPNQDDAQAVIAVAAGV
jgi:hypothetical protein